MKRASPGNFPGLALDQIPTSSSNSSSVNFPDCTNLLTKGNDHGLAQKVIGVGLGDVRGKRVPQQIVGPTLDSLSLRYALLSPIVSEPLTVGTQQPKEEGLLQGFLR